MPISNVPPSGNVPPSAGGQGPLPNGQDLRKQLDNLNSDIATVTSYLQAGLSFPAQGASEDVIEDLDGLDNAGAALEKAASLADQQKGKEMRQIVNAAHIVFRDLANNVSDCGQALTAIEGLKEGLGSLAEIVDSFN